jgi:hypothetical protein
MDIVEISRSRPCRPLGETMTVLQGGGKPGSNAGWSAA